MSLAGIISYYVTALAAIDGTGAYVTDVQTINRKPANPLKQATDTLPSLEVSAADGEHVMATRGRDTVTETLEIEGWIAGQPGEDHSPALLALWEDVKRVVRVDLTCGGAAASVQLTRHEFLYGEDQAGLLQRLTVTYSESRTNA